AGCGAVKARGRRARHAGRSAGGPVVPVVEQDLEVRHVRGQLEEGLRVLREVMRLLDVLAGIGADRRVGLAAHACRSKRGGSFARKARTPSRQSALAKARSDRAGVRRAAYDSRISQ